MSAVVVGVHGRTRPVPGSEPDRVAQVQTHPEMLPILDRQAGRQSCHQAMGTQRQGGQHLGAVEL